MGVHSFFRHAFIEGPFASGELARPGASHALSTFTRPASNTAGSIWKTFINVANFTASPIGKSGAHIFSKDYWEHTNGKSFV